MNAPSTRLTGPPQVAFSRGRSWVITRLGWIARSTSSGRDSTSGRAGAPSFAPVTAVAVPVKVPIRLPAAENGFANGPKFGQTSVLASCRWGLMRSPRTGSTVPSAATNCPSKRMSVRLSGVGKKSAPTNVIACPIPIFDSWIASKLGPPLGGTSSDPQPAAAASNANAATAGIPVNGASLAS